MKRRERERGAQRDGHRGCKCGHASPRLHDQAGKCERGAGQGEIEMAIVGQIQARQKRIGRCELQEIPADRERQPGHAATRGEHRRGERDEQQRIRAQQRRPRRRHTQIRIDVGVAEQRMSEQIPMREQLPHRLCGEITRGQADAEEHVVARCRQRRERRRGQHAGISAQVPKLGAQRLPVRPCTQQRHGRDHQRSFAHRQCEREQRRPRPGERTTRRLRARGVVGEQCGESERDGERDRTPARVGHGFGRCGMQREQQGAEQGSQIDALE